MTTTINRGYITVGYTVWCGECGNWDRLDTSSIRAAKSIWKTLGWVWSKNKGWSCIHCAKQLSDAKVKK